MHGRRSFFYNREPRLLKGVFEELKREKLQKKIKEENFGRWLTFWSFSLNWVFLPN